MALHVFFQRRKRGNGCLADAQASAEATRKNGAPLLVCAGGKSSAEGTEISAGEPLDATLI